MFKASGRRRDGLALSHALPDRSLFAMVAAMSLLAALTWAGAFGARSLSARWEKGAAALVTVQVADPDKSAEGGRGSRIEAVLSALQSQAGVSDVHRLDAQELDRLLKPWLGVDGAAALPLPAVVEVHLVPAQENPSALSGELQKLAPGTLTERNDDWRARLQALAGSLLGCAVLALGLVGIVGASVIGMATQLGLSARRGSITILHGLGAADGYVAGRFARHIAVLSFTGGIAGTLVSILPVVVVARLMAPLSGPQAVTVSGATDAASVLSGAALLLRNGDLPHDLLTGLLCVPFVTMLIGWLTAQMIVRLWLRRLP